MHFCSNCKNMYYIQLDESNTNTLIYYCKKCGNKSEYTQDQSVIVSKTYIHKNKSNFDQYMNQYTKLDPSLPHIKNIPCPNKECITNKSHTTDDMSDDTDSTKTENEVIYVRYDNTNLKYIYMCVHCDHIWNMSNS